MNIILDILKTNQNKYVARIRPYTKSSNLLLTYSNSSIFFSYSTIAFDKIQEAESEAKAFCKWKKLKIRKIIREYKKKK